MHRNRHIWTSGIGTGFGLLAFAGLVCLSYIELNMIRCGVVRHPSQWEWVGYHEIMGRRQRYQLVDLEPLCWRLGTASLGEVRENLECRASGEDRAGRTETGTVLDGESGRGQRGIREASSAADSEPKSSLSLVNQLFNKMQIASAAYMAFSHGNNDAQKTMGIITMALVSYYQLPDFVVPKWVMVLCALAMALGTALGGWRIIMTLGVKLVDLKPIHGFAAEASAAPVIEVASGFGLPLSTKHIISSTIMGVGATKRLSAVRWGVAGRIGIAWVITLPACAILAWSICTLLLFL